jgi:CRISPR/Cas system CSM-associated protein Csm3 (group 7 of RAMP superfamily)
MRTLQLQIKLLSSTLVGSGESGGAIIDTDIIFDEIGLPYIPAKRMKGCLRDSAEQVQYMLRRSGIPFRLEFDGTFGKIGEEFDELGKRWDQVSFSNLTITNFTENVAWLQYLLQHRDAKGEQDYARFLSRQTIINTFTALRQQTMIDNKTGVAQDHSLRTMRILNKGWQLAGDIRVETDTEQIIDTLALACLNLRQIGTKRNRGFGEIECRLFDGNTEISVLEKLR